MSCGGRTQRSSSQKRLQTTLLSQRGTQRHSSRFASPLACATRDADDGHGDVTVRRNRVTPQTQLSDCDGKGKAVSNGTDDMDSVEIQRPDNFNGKLRKTSRLDTVSASAWETSSG